MSSEVFRGWGPRPPSLGARLLTSPVRFQSVPTAGKSFRGEELGTAVSDHCGRSGWDLFLPGVGVSADTRPYKGSLRGRLPRSVTDDLTRSQHLCPTRPDLDWCGVVVSPVNEGQVSPEDSGGSCEVKKTWHVRNTSEEGTRPGKRSKTGVTFSRGIPGGNWWGGFNGESKDQREVSER